MELFRQDNGENPIRSAIEQQLNDYQNFLNKSGQTLHELEYNHAERRPTCRKRQNKIRRAPELETPRDPDKIIHDYRATTEVFTKKVLGLYRTHRTPNTHSELSQDEDEEEDDCHLPSPPTESWMILDLCNRMEKLTIHQPVQVSTVADKVIQKPAKQGAPKFDRAASQRFAVHIKHINRQISSAH